MGSNKTFDRSICFTFFEDYRKTAIELEKDFGKNIVADYYNAIIDYALYGVVPELNGALKYVWPTTKSTIDKSISRRESGFARENTEQTEQVLEYKKNHPEATQREIAKETGISLGKVNKVINRNIDSSASSNSNSDSNTNTTMNVNVNAINSDIAIAIIDMFKAKTKYKDIQNKIKTDFDIDISYDEIKHIIDNKNSYIALAEKEAETKRDNYFKQVEYDCIPDVVEKLTARGIDTTYDEVKTAYDKIQNSNLCSKWNIRELTEDCYLNDSFIGNTKTLSEYTDKIIEFKDSMFGYGL